MFKLRKILDRVFHKQEPVVEVQEPITVIAANNSDEDVLKILYPYQKEAVTTTFENDRGTICMPTGTGKTFCQAAIIADSITKNNNGFGMYVINAPRILLTYQLLKEVFGFLGMHGIDARYMFVHSGASIDKQEISKIKRNLKIENIKYAQINSGTNPVEISAFMEIARNQDLPLVMFSTYDSAPQIEIARLISGIGNINITLNDEAHYLIQEQYHDVIDTLIDEREYFFTATRRSPERSNPDEPYLGRGMDNVEKYGELLFNMTPREAIELGKMVRPRMHIVNTDRDYNTDDFERSMSRTVMVCYEQHSEIIGNRINGKMLVAVKEAPDILEFINSREYRMLRDEGVDIFAIASDPSIGCDTNGEKVSRTTFLKRLKHAGEDHDWENCDKAKYNPKHQANSMIVLHYDILAEGIDVSGFTGILPLRTLNMSKFLQTFGRCARVHPIDKRKLNAGDIEPNELSEMVKPYAYVILPNITMENLDDRQHIERIVRNMREFDFNTNEDVVLSSANGGFSEDEEIEELNDLDTLRREVGVMIQTYEAEIEAEEDARLSTSNFMKKISVKLEGY